MMQEPNPMPTGERSWSEYHKSYLSGVTGFAAFLCGFGIGALLTSFLTDSVSSIFGGLLGGVVLPLWYTRVAKRDQRRRAELEAASTRQKWTNKETETLRKIEEMKRKRNASRALQLGYSVEERYEWE